MDRLSLPHKPTPHHTRFFYVTRKNPKNVTRKLALRKVSSARPSVCVVLGRRGDGAEKASCLAAVAPSCLRTLRFSIPLDVSQNCRF